MSKLTVRGRESHKERDSRKVNLSDYLKGIYKMEIVWFIVIIAAYFLLQGVILPKLGIST